VQPRLPLPHRLGGLLRPHLLVGRFPQKVVPAQMHLLGPGRALLDV